MTATDDHLKSHMDPVEHRKSQMDPRQWKCQLSAPVDVPGAIGGPKATKMGQPNMVGGPPHAKTR